MYEKCAVAQFILFISSETLCLHAVGLHSVSEEGFQTDPGGCKHIRAAPRYPGTCVAMNYRFRKELCCSLFPCSVEAGRAVQA